MIQSGTVLKVTDKTGVVLVKRIKVSGYAKRRIAYIGDVIVVTVERINPKKFHKVKLFRKKKFFKGTIHRGLVVRTKTNYCRQAGVSIRSNENAVVLVNKRTVPISNRVFGPILREPCMRFPSSGCTTRYMI
jgi:large subunit ribosomal protein L14